jgi:hypothetical protein
MKLSPRDEYVIRHLTKHAPVPVDHDLSREELQRVRETWALSGESAALTELIRVRHATLMRTSTELLKRAAASDPIERRRQQLDAAPRSGFVRDLN